MNLHRVDTKKLYERWAWLLVTVLLTAQTAMVRAQNAPPMQLRITILDGEGSLNNIRERTAREPIVQVEDENHKPVAGALILFTIHGQGDAGATFSNGLTTYQTTTDAAGKAVAKGLMPNGHAGSFTISVTATMGSITAEAVIHQQNVAPSATVNQIVKPHHALVTAGNIAFVGVVAAIGAVLSWSAVNANSGPGSTTIQPGTGGVTAPTGTAAIRHR